MAASSLPKTHKALVQNVYAEPLVVEERSTPQPTPGAVIVKVEYSPVISYMRDVYNGKRKYDYPTPLVPGTSAIGRVAAVGPDATLLKQGDLVYVDCYIHGRDDPDAVFLMGLSEGGTDASRALMRGEWLNGSFAEYAKVPLENTFKLDEHRLLGNPSQGGLGYKMEQLCWFMAAIVPYGGLRSIGLQVGETVIVAPATGGFGSAAVVVALAMGARVIAMGRNKEALAGVKALDPARVNTVPMTGDLKAEKEALKSFGKIDAFFDISPNEAANSTHYLAAITSLRRGGRMSMMGGIRDTLAIPHRYIMRYDLTLKGKWMYDREDNLAFMDLLTSGNLKLDVVKTVGTFGLKDWEEAFELAFNNGRLGELVVLKP